jgi:hypothetical protein
VVKADADTLGTSEISTAASDTCCGTAACCTSEEKAVDPTQTAAQAKAAAGCGCTN